MMQPSERHGNTWVEIRAGTVDELVQHITSLKRQTVGEESLAWRGHTDAEWSLESTLDRHLGEISPNDTYEAWLAREQRMLSEFRRRAERYAGATEGYQLKDDWTAMALGRHAGLPTRLLDWTDSPWVAVWFACHEDSDVDGMLWWFHQQQLEHAIHPHWNKWGVADRATVLGYGNMPRPEKERLGWHERALETTAFKPDGEAWVTKIHYRYPCSRMEAQRAFMTTCGRLRTSHNDAIDRLPDSNTISRGRIRIAASIKGEALQLLREMNIHAQSLSYPGVDIVAREIGNPNNK